MTAKLHCDRLPEVADVFRLDLDFVMLPIYINRVFTLRLQIYTRHAGHASLLYWMKSVGIVDRGLALRSGLGLLSLLLLCAEYFLNQFGRLLLFSNFLEHFVGDA